MKSYGIKNSYFQILLWGLYLILFPFQFFPPGSPQIADLLMVFGIFSIFLKKWAIDNYIQSSSYFVIYSILVGLIYSIIYFDIEFLKLPLNYFYCVLSLIFVSQIAHHPRFISLSILAIFISLVIQLYVLKVIGFNEEQFRFILYFNNPNQLGLWALTCLVFVSFLIQTYRKSISTVFLLISSLVLSIFYISLSISQAAIISAVLIVAILIVIFFRLKWIYTILPIIVLLFYLFINDIKNSEIKFLINIENRINNEVNEDDGDNGLEGRNYTRLMNYPEYLLLGSGEGKIDRFGKDGLEIHSTYANILFSYGVVGLVFILLPILNFIKRKPLVLSLFLGAYLVFTLVHNTIRWPLFWIIPYLMYVIPSSRFEIKKDEIV